MQYLVAKTAEHETRPVLYGPFSSFAQACAWAKINPLHPRAETDGVIRDGERFVIRVLHRP